MIFKNVQPEDLDTVSMVSNLIAPAGQNSSNTTILVGACLAPNTNRATLFENLASASYIAVPAAMKIAVPKASPSLYIPMALAITFPFNITLGMPIYLYVIQNGT